MQQPLTGYPLSPQQRRLWSKQGSQAPHPARLRLNIEGPLDASRLRKALDRAVARHEILRTSFQRQSGMKFPFQVIGQSTGIVWTTMDLCALDPARQEIQIQQFWSLESVTCFDQLAPVRAALWTLSPSRYCATLSLSPLCVDSPSLNRLAYELACFYENPEQTLDEPVQYADYSQWRNDLLKNEDDQSRETRAFWDAPEFSSTPALLLPYQGKPASELHFRSRSLPVTISREVRQRLEQAAGSGIASVLIACWTALLSRLSGQSELVLGYLNQATAPEGLNKSLGLFAVRLPLFCSITASDSIISLADSLGTKVADILQRADYFDPERSAADPTAGFVIEQMGSTFQAGEVRISVHSIDCQPDAFQALLRCQVGAGYWIASLDYDPQVLAEGAAQVTINHFENLLHNVAYCPQSAVHSLDILDERERQRILVSFNDTEDSSPQPASLQQAFEKQADLTPERPAVRFGEQTFTYADLNQRANRVAHFLRRCGVTANVAVALCFERSAEMIVGLLGILKAGACYLPLAPDNPKTRVEHQLRDAAVSVLLTQQHLLERLPEFSGTTLCFDRDASLLMREHSSNPENISRPDDLAYVIYTSGSTGVPKAVAVRQRNLVNYAMFMCSRLDVEKSETGLHFATVSPISADLGNTCIFPAIISGGCLHVINYETAMAANLLADYLAKHPIDILKITPSHLSGLLAAPEGDAVLRLGCLVLGGEATRWELANRIMRSSNCRLLNHYGPTEATIGCCTLDVRTEGVSSWNPATVPIGRPIANTQIFILDDRMEPVPLGVAGEIYIGGAGVAQGYLNQPQQTAERFVTDPFSANRDSRLYRTGDLARFLPDGNIEFLGRIDQQVKIRGFRVEPAEIEAVLKKHPAVRQVVIAAYEENLGDKRLAAYVVTGEPVQNDELKSFLAGYLPEYMLPTIIPIEKLPLTANGKVDTRALPSPKRESETVHSVAMPTNATEQAVADIWTEVLGLERVGIHDDFFELGGHSLLATQIISRIRNAFRVQMPLHSFLETPTVAGLAEKISQCPAAESEEEYLARLLKEIEGLSEEEVEKLLAAEQSRNAKSGGD